MNKRILKSALKRAASVCMSAVVTCTAVLGGAPTAVLAADSTTAYKKHEVADSNYRNSDCNAGLKNDPSCIGGEYQNPAKQIYAYALFNSLDFENTDDAISAEIEFANGYGDTGIVNIISLGDYVYQNGDVITFTGDIPTVTREGTTVATGTMLKNGYTPTAYDWREWNDKHNEKFSIDYTKGTQTIMISVKNYCRIWSVKFSHNALTSPLTAELKTSGGQVTTDITQAASVSAAATMSKSTASPYNAKLVLAVYDGNGTVKKIKADSKSTQEGTPGYFNLSDSLTGYGLDANSYIAAFIIGEDSKFLGEPVILGKKPTAAAAATEKTVATDVDGVSVTVYGKSDAESVIVGFRPKTAQNADFESYEYIMPVTVTDGYYKAEFSARNGSTAGTFMPTGDYTPVVFDGKKIVNGDNLYSVRYVAPQDIVNCITAINECVQLTGETEIEALKRILIANKEFVGIDFSTIDSDFIYTNLYASRDYDTNSMAGFTSRYNELARLETLRNTAAASGIASYIDANAEDLGLLSNTLYKDYWKKNKISKTSAGERIVRYLSQDTSGAVNSNAEFEKLFTKAVICTLFEEATAWGTTDKYLNTYSSYISSASYTTYITLDSDTKKLIASELIGIRGDEYAEIGAALDAAFARHSSVPITSEQYPHLAVGDDITIAFVVPQMPTDEELLPTFGDVSGYWAKDQINEMYNSGILSGKADGLFFPDDYITRAEFVKILVCALDCTDAEARSDFSDVAADYWAYPYISTAAQLGLSAGYADGSFGAQRLITREEMAVLVCRAAEYIGKNLHPRTMNVSFTDAEQISDWALESVMKLARAKIISGAGQGRFEPKLNATRAEVAVLVYNLIND